MSVIAKKYANAIINDGLTDSFYEKLSLISSAFLIDKFNIIINSKEISKKQKLDLILSFFDNLDIKFKNFLTLLADNSRLNFIPQITKELKKQKAIKDNYFEGVIYTKEKIEQDKINTLENKFESKLNCKIKLNNITGDIDGVKVNLDELGYEISFSTEILKNKINEYILKTI